MAGFLFKL